MKIARIQKIHGGSVLYALLEDDRYMVIKDPFAEKIEITGEEVAFDQAHLLAPVEPRQIIAIGVNYREHAAECGRPLPDAPVVFVKTLNTLIGSGEDIVLPAMAPDEVDFEAELAIVVGKTAKNITPEQADDYILGYTCAMDISARDCQLRLDMQWARGKCFDTFCPAGPCIATGLDGDNLGISLKLNGETMQDSNTSDMIFGCRYLVSYLSRCMTLMPGSMILTGTPPGVGVGREPKVFLRPGDKLEMQIEGIGRLEHRVTAEKI
ncbi:Ureidoglycolate lyase [Limihaloglobus sulfuriphilus]|uniref:Ureidoglycolate lyase n=1 Tax=Limihaloglobus sulfuriphilus TaxID=1851148 RepID=A0A1Q2MGN2_9BACT|nr:fumarylacetoacetate hydrolase family protein [Limihaloglobus sulfuriphilus]AQQ71865.1 Ureidoglycolate lyase [Limihaloglobus sulfuriphilus]